MNSAAEAYGYKFAAASLGVDPDEYSAKGGIPKRASAAVGRQICLAGALLFRAAGAQASPAFEKLAVAVQSEGWNDWQAEAAADVVAVLEPLASLGLVKQSNGLLSLGGSILGQTAGALKKLNPAFASTEGLMNLYMNILGASAVGGAGAGALNWYNKRQLEKEDKDVEEARAEHMILRQSIGDIEARMAAREAGRL